PGTSFTIMEMPTEEIVKSLKSGRLDIGILVTPLDDKEIREIPVFYEPILLYTSRQLKYYHDDRVSLKALSTEDLLLLQEGHCFRGQVMNLCSAKGQRTHKQLNTRPGRLRHLRQWLTKTMAIR